MTNFDQATRSFTLHSEGTESYSWAWENMQHSDCVGDMKLVGKTAAEFARDWSNTLLKACVDQISSEGERGFTAEEIEADLRDDVATLATALQAWLEGSNEPDEPEEDDQEPFTVATSWWFNGAGGLDTLTVKAWASEESFRTQNPNVKLVPARDGIRNHTKWMIDSVYDHPEGGENA